MHAFRGDILSKVIQTTMTCFISLRVSKIRVIVPEVLRRLEHSFGKVKTEEAGQFSWSGYVDISTLIVPLGLTISLIVRLCGAIAG